MIDNEELTLETYTREELDTEEAQRIRRQTMAAGLARRLTGTAGDLTADMFDAGETPLFNHVRR